MSDKVKKFLAKLNSQELLRVSAVVDQIVDNDMTKLDAKALKGKAGYIRVRVGRVRIICKQVNGGYEVLHITYRDERTYKNL